MSKVLLCYEDFSELMSIQSILKKVGFDVLPISSEFSLSEQILSFNPDIVVAHGNGGKVSTLGVGRRLKDMHRWGGRSVLVFNAGAKPQPTELSRIRMDMALEAPLEITRLIQVLANLTGQDPQAMIERMLRGAADEAGHSIRVGGSSGGGHAKDDDSIRVGSSGGAKAKDDGATFVSGGKGAADQWNVKGGSELDQFNEMIRNSVGSEGEAKIPVGGDAGLTAEDIERNRLIQEQLAAAEAKVHDKVKSYEKYIAVKPASAHSQLKRTETRKAQKELQKGWSEAALKNQDELRRQFADALFKKKN